MESFAIFALLLLLVGLVLRRALPTHRPRGLPFVGKVFGRPTRHPWLTYLKWGATFGDVMSFKVFGQPIIVLNSFKAVSDLLEKRSNNYSARPVFHMADELMGWGWNMALMPNADSWRSRRKLFHQHFQARHLASYYPAQLGASVILLRNILHSPEDFISHVFYHPSSLILRIAYGYDSKEKNDWYVQLASRSAVPIVTAMTPGAFLVDFLPFLKYVPSWFPFADFQKVAKASAQDSVDMRDKPYEEVLDSINNETAAPSFVDTNLAKLRRTDKSADFDEDAIRDAAASYVLILTIIMAMVNHPEVQQRAQAELDTVVGRQRLPDFNDRPQLPFLQALILESFRWRPVTPLSIAHASKGDDVYNGYFIPAGSIIFPNVWAIMHDKEMYKDPETFNPDRFMGDNPEASPAMTGGFGFGRRICPGRFLALDTAYIAVASLLWAFTMTNAVDTKGEKIPIDDMGYDGLFVSHRLPYKCKMTPRFPSVVAVVDSA
ncbi:cytochrome P450 [Hymenopellis radicata]|nr:cytochrome P450 [Hymenopellis radicata]